ncbi:MAG: hypothetical protein AAFN77_00430 [Planctomycetota bacterium]
MRLLFSNRWLVPLMSIVLCAVSFVSIGDAQQVSDDQQIAELVADLTSDQFLVRQQAMERLKAFGNRARDSLLRASQSEDAELAVRAKRLLEQMDRLEVTNLSNEEQQLWRRLKDATPQVRLTMFQSTASRKSMAFVMRALEAFPDIRSVYFNADAASFNMLLLNATVEDRWDDVVWAVQHPITQAEAPAICYHYHHCAGTLDSFIETQVKELQELKESGAVVPQRRVLSLIAVLRMQGRFEQARSLIKVLPTSFEDDLNRQLLLESGDWSKVLSNLVDPIDKRPGDGKIAANQTQFALIQQLAGDAAAYQQTVEEIQQGLQTAKSEKNEIGIAIAKGQLLTIGLTSLDWSLTKPYLDPSKEYENFAIYSELLRYDEAYQLIGLGNTRESRRSWFDQRLSEFSELNEAQKKLKSNAKARREKLTEVNNARSLILSVIDQLGMLGFDAECDLYAQRLFVLDQSNYTTRNRIFVNLLAHERYQTIWNLLGNGLPQSQVVSLSQQLFSERFTNLSALVSAISQKHRDPIEQMKILAALTNSPLNIFDEYDFEIELARYLSYGQFFSTGTPESYAAQILRLHGREAESQAMTEEARKLGNIYATNAVMKETFQSGKDEEAIEMLEATWRRLKNPAEALLAAECLRRLAERETDPAKKQVYLQRSIQAKFAAAASWQSRSYSVVTALRTIESYQSERLCKFLLQSSVYVLNGTGVVNSRYQPQLIQTLGSDSCQLSKQAAIQSAINLFDQLTINNVSSKTGLNWVASSLSLHQLTAMGEISEGKHEAGTDRLIRIAQFHPLYTASGEKTIAMLDEAGAREDAERLFRAITNPYAKILTQYPRSALHRNNYAWICACAKRRLDSVDRHIEFARQLRPNHAGYADTMAEIRFQQGKRDEALKLNAESILLNPRKDFYRQQRVKFLNGSKQ